MSSPKITRMFGFRAAAAGCAAAGVASKTFVEATAAASRGTLIANLQEARSSRPEHTWRVAGLCDRPRQADMGPWAYAAKITRATRRSGEPACAAPPAGAGWRPRDAAEGAPRLGSMRRHAARAAGRQEPLHVGGGRRARR